MQTTIGGTLYHWIGIRAYLRHLRTRPTPLPTSTALTTWPPMRPIGHSHPPASRVNPPVVRLTLGRRIARLVFGAQVVMIIVLALMLLSLVYLIVSTQLHITRPERMGAAPPSPIHTVHGARRTVHPPLRRGGASSSSSSTCILSSSSASASTSASASGSATSADSASHAASQASFSGCGCPSKKSLSRLSDS